MNTNRKARPAGFTLTELLVVVGLIALLISLLMPALNRARAASNAVTCLSNLRQMGMAWSNYVTENHGRLPEYLWQTPANPDVAWRAYWLGILETYKVHDDTILCPAARDVIPFNQNRGYGSAAYAWTGKYQSPGTVVRYNVATYRDSSYGYNRYLTVGGGFGTNGLASRITSVRQLCDVPVFMDAIFADFRPTNGSEGSPVASPPNLRGDSFPANAPDHWRFLIARHGRGVNTAMADGSARWVPLEETYALRWKTDWVRYRLALPLY